MLRCPKCRGTVLWIETVQGVQHIRCHCGLCLPVVEELDGGMTVTRNVAPQILLPARGSKLARCLRLLRDMEVATSGEIADRLSQTVVMTSTQLCTLESRGLATRLSRKKGAKGGSTWTLTETAVKALGE
jgi:hypothetical protein